MIRAEVHDDEFRTSARFDATEWFEQATDDEILELAKIDWRGDYAADCVAEYFEGQNIGAPETIEQVFQATNVLDCGFEVSVEPDDAIRWVEKNRPHLMEQINEL